MGNTWKIFRNIWIVFGKWVNNIWTIYRQYFGEQDLVFSVKLHFGLTLYPLPFSLFPFPFSLIPYPLSLIPYPLSLIPYPLSPIPYPLSPISYPLSPILYPLPLISRPYKSIQDHKTHYTAKCESVSP